MSLPIFKTDDTSMSLMQTKWKSEIDPFLSNPMNQSTFLKNVVLINGDTVINHKLGRLPQGWIIVDINGSASVYRSKPFNTLTLTLTSNANVTVSLEVF